MKIKGGVKTYWQAACFYQPLFAAEGGVKLDVWLFGVRHVLGE